MISTFKTYDGAGVNERKKSSVFLENDRKNCSFRKKQWKSKRILPFSRETGEIKKGSAVHICIIVKNRFFKLRKFRSTQ